MGRSSAGGGKGFGGFVQLVALPLLLANGYAAWRLSHAGNQFHVRILPGNIAGSLGALVTLLTVNIAVIVALLLLAGGKRK